MMNHDDMERWLNEYLDGSLSESERNRVAQCIEEEPTWSEEYGRLKNLRDRAGALPRTIAPPRDLWPEIEAKIRRAPAPEPRRRIWSFMPQWAPAGIVLVAAVVIAILVRPTESPLPYAPTDGHGTAARTGALPAIVQALDHECFGAGKHLVASIHERISPIGGAATTSIQNDLEILESAIEETRTALEEDPGNTRVLRILTELYEQKLSLLHRAMQLTRVA